MTAQLRQLDVERRQTVPLQLYSHVDAGAFSQEGLRPPHWIDQEGPELCPGRIIHRDVWVFWGQDVQQPAHRCQDLEVPQALEAYS
jgi:hypothetical protein